MRRARARDVWRIFLSATMVVSSCMFADSIQAQLVNPGFEESTAMPLAPGMWYLLPGWSNAGSGLSTPDFFHLDGGLGGDLPETPIAMVQPSEGRGIAGIAAIKRTGPSQPLAREYLVMELSESLEVGQEYTLSFEVTNGQWLPTSAAGLSVNALGMAFSVEEPVQLGTGAISSPAAFQFSYSRYDEDWERISFTFFVAGPSRYLTVGVFEPDELLDVEEVMGESPLMAYYFFDDFQLVKVNPEEGLTPAEQTVKGPGTKPSEDETLPVYVPNAFSPNGDGLNDLFLPSVGDVKPAAFEIYTRWGQRLAQLDPGNPVWDGRDMEGHILDPGTYVWRMEWPSMPGFAARTKQGAVTVLH